MNVFDEAKKRPVMSGITLVGAAGVVVLAMNVMPGLELIVRIKKAPDVADAALQKATESREWIDKYLEDQETQRAFDQKLAEQAAEYQRQMLELQRQQQQMPNQPSRRMPRQQPQVWIEQDDYGDVYCTDGQEWWWPDEEGDCE